MRADRVDVSWDAAKSKWLVRIDVGAEVIRRFCNISQSADEQALRSAAVKTMQDEGYDPDPGIVAIKRAG